MIIDPNDVPVGVDIVYLIHFDPPYYHARHYCGQTANLPRRLDEHKAGYGSPLVKAAYDAGCELTVVRIWRGGRQLERQIKDQHNGPRFCPLCNTTKGA